MYIPSEYFQALYHSESNILNECIPVCQLLELQFLLWLTVKTYDHIFCRDQINLDPVI